MRFGIKEVVVDCKMIKVPRKDADGNVCKEELPFFTDTLLKETLAQLLEEILTMQEHFKWFSADGDDNNNVNNKKKLILQHFGGGIKGDAPT